MIRFSETVNFARVYKYMEKFYPQYMNVVDKAHNFRHVLTYVEIISYIAENCPDTERVAYYLINECVDREVY